MGTSFELVFGRNATMSNGTKTNLDPVYNVQNYSKEVKYRLQKMNILAKQLIGGHKQRNKAFYDIFAKSIQLQVNDTVYLQKQPYDKHSNIYDIKGLEGGNAIIFD